MYIETLKLRNFRNYANQVINFKNGMNIMLGPNGVGKTNLLEAIYLLSTTRSHRNDDDREMISFDQEFAAVEGIVNNNNGKDKIDIIIHKTGKSLMINNVAIKKNSQFIGRENAVLFSPSDMNLFDSSPRERRRFIDMEMGKLSSVYMQNLSLYLKALKQRNAFLKKSDDRVLLDTYTEMLYEPQMEIISERNEFVNSLNEYLTYFYDQISGSSSRLTMVYKSFIREKEEREIMKKQLQDTYESYLERDIYLKMTNTGIHREDYEFYLDEMDVSKYCSQGQKRMVILAIKLSVMQIIYQIKREYPILLLDDVFSELDSQHRLCLLKLLPASVQTIITTTDLRELDNLRNQNVNILSFGKGVK